MTEVGATGLLPSAGGGPVRLRLFTSGDGTDTELRIDREERLPHKLIEWTVLKVVRPTATIYPLARELTTILCELERLHHRGYWLRQRAGGGWRGAWRADLLPPGGSRPALSWEIQLRKPEMELAALSGSITALDPPAYRSDEVTGNDDLLVEAMRQHGDEVRRRQAIDALIAADPAAPIDDFLQVLDTQGLLDSHDE